MQACQQNMGKKYCEQVRITKTIYDHVIPLIYGVLTIKLRHFMDESEQSVEISTFFELLER